jgi:acetoin utilization protein AcuB
MSKKMPQLLSLMTPFPYHIDAKASLVEARDMMSAYDIHHLPVMDDGELETIISDRDIARVTSLGHRLEEDNLQVKDVCPPRAYFADVADPADRVLRVMAEKHIGAVIITKDGELAGIFTDMDACRVLASELAKHYDSPLTPPGDDAA